MKIPRPRPIPAYQWAAMFAAAVMISYQVAGKAVRDAVFLTTYPVTQLPAMVISAAMASIASSYFAGRWLDRHSPERLVPFAFLASAALQFVEWMLLGRFPRVVAPIIYLHILAFSSILLSGFWSILNEQLSPREARKLFGRITGMGTAGGILGGLVAERVAALFGMGSVILQLVAAHALCALLLAKLSVPGSSRPAAVRESAGVSPWSAFSRVPYLPTLALLVVLGASSASAFDYLFKYQATLSFGKGPNLLRFLALFYTAGGVLTFLFQMLFLRLSLEKFGLGQTVGSLPAVTTTGSLLSLALPGFPPIAGTRILELATRGSLFRGGYELFYAPIPANEKRPVKSLIDVGCDRMGDAFGSAVVQTALVASPGTVRWIILGFTAIAGVISMRVAARLNKGYGDVVRHGLLQRASVVDPAFFEDLESLNAAGQAVSIVAAPSIKSSATPVRPVSAPAPAASDKVVSQLIALRSGDPSRIQSVLSDLRVLDALLVPQLVRLLATDEFVPSIIRILSTAGTHHTGLLTDMLADPLQDLAVSRRIPRILAALPSQKACDGLLDGLLDERFEVRFHCGRALDSLLQQSPLLRIRPEMIYETVIREVSVNRSVWDSRRVLDRHHEADEFSYLDDVLRHHAHQSLELVFSLLALVLPRKPIRTSFRALHSGDHSLRELALEYLEGALPPHVRTVLWPVLDSDPTVVPQDTRERAVRTLLLTERGLLQALKKIDDVQASESGRG